MTIETSEVSVLLVEDEPAIRESVQAYLRREGYLVTAVADGQQAMDAFDNGSYQAVILDLMLPVLSGEDVARHIRDVSDVPIIMLTAKNDVDERIAGIELGADDYLGKPFSPLELMARVRSLIRRSHAAEEPQRDILEFNDLSIDVPRRRVIAKGQDIRLTQSEFNLLLALARFPGRVYQRMELANQILGYEYRGYERAIDSHVKNLRAKLGDDIKKPQWLITVHGVGYRFASPKNQKSN
ncbi:MAG: response regulator transcription factor [Actinomycetia bacterium]|nr:response regulator transcription factor [Actinomycetes bacterium]